MNRELEDVNETGESSMKKQTEKNVKSVINWVILNIYIFFNESYINI